MTKIEKYRAFCKTLNLQKRCERYNIGYIRTSQILSGAKPMTERWDLAMQTRLLNFSDDLFELINFITKRTKGE